MKNQILSSDHNFGNLSLHINQDLKSIKFLKYFIRNSQTWRVISGLNHFLIPIKHLGQ